jgi:hypothetical protein
MTFDRMHETPVTRAMFYGPQETTWAVAADGMRALDIDHVTVDVDVTELGRVTISGSGTPNDAFGVEFDLQPAAAKALARQLVLAAEALEDETERQ